MVHEDTDNMTPQRQATRQQSLFGPNLPSTLDVAGPDVPCDVFAIEKRRDGGTATGAEPIGPTPRRRAAQPAKCRAADMVPIRAEEILTLDLDKYLGGVALWGAVPAVYDTTRLNMDRGIHVHARLTPDSPKEMDLTYRAVRLFGRGLPDEGVVVSEIDAIYYMVSSVFRFPMFYVTCTHCGWPHLDKDWFCVHPHRRHLCAGCGKHFHDRVIGIGNPIVGIRDACGFGEHKIVPGCEDAGYQAIGVPRRHSDLGVEPGFSVDEFQARGRGNPRPRLFGWSDRAGTG